MVTQQLIDFIKEQLADGKQEKDLKQTLVLHGWAEQDVDEAIRLAHNPASFVPTPPSLIQSSTQTNSAKEIMGIKELFIGAWGIFKNNLLKFWLASLTYAFIITAIAVGFFFLFQQVHLFRNIVGLALGSLYIAIMMLGQHIISAWDGGINNYGVIIFLSIIALWISTMTSSQIFNLLIAESSENKRPLGEIIKNGFKKLIPFGWLRLLIAMSISAGILIIPMLGYISMMTARVTQSSAILINVMGFIIATIFIIKYGVVYSQAKFIYLFGEEGILGSIIRSRHYIRRNWWKVFGRLSLIYAIPTIINALTIYLIIGNPVLIWRITGHSNILIVVLIASINLLLFSPFTAICLRLLYKNLRDKSKYLDPIKKGRISLIISVIIGLVAIIAIIAMGYMFGLALSA